jgi:ATP-dependent DNA helicase PIF1
MEDCWNILDNFHKEDKEIHTINMNQEQSIAFESVKKGHSIFLTGRAGAGKTFTVTKIIEWAKSNKKNIGITATTGASAILIGGQTIQSFMGIGSGDANTKEMVNMVLAKSRKVKLLKSLDILIIDEVSMLDDLLFEKISDILSIIRDNPSAPFGGVQLVLCGDFSQNCPIDGKKYCFMSEYWKESNIQTIFLKKFMRHQDDVEFQEILESIRVGKTNKTILTRLEKLKKTKFPDGDIVEPTILYGRNVDADLINTKNYGDLVREKGAVSKTFETIAYGKDGKSWAQSCKVPDKIDLCIGAQVMITWNISVDGGLINGTRGVIVDFSPFPVIQLSGSSKRVMIEPHTIKNENSPDSSIIFMPLKLAWALTIAKSQGCTLDYCIIDLDTWAYGQAYTALSRARSLKHIKLIGDIKSEYFKASPDVIKFYDSIKRI